MRRCKSMFYLSLIFYRVFWSVNAISHRRKNQAEVLAQKINDLGSTYLKSDWPISVFVWYWLQRDLNGLTNYNIPDIHIRGNDCFSWHIFQQFSKLENVRISKEVISCVAVDINVWFISSPHRPIKKCKGNDANTWSQIKM